MIRRGDEGWGVLPDAAETVIIGGGVMGLSIAYNLCTLGVKDVVVVEGNYLAYGASGRNGGGIRQQWGTEANIVLMQESVELCRRFAKDMGINVWFRQGGYLFLARDEAQVRRLEKTAELQQGLGLPTRLLDPKEALKVVPELDTSSVLAACYNPSDGILFPWPFLWGYAKRSMELGARLFTHTVVEGIERGAGDLEVRTTRGSIRAQRVINATGAWSPKIAAMLGIHLPNQPIRHEICSSEPLKPFLQPMVSDLGSGLYCSQSMRGEIVGGISLPNEPKTLEMKSSLAFLRHYAKNLTQLMPVLRNVKVLRQWSGPYDQSPDGNPILGEAPTVPGFFLACGFVGHGFMMAPIIGKLYAEWLSGGSKAELFDHWTLSRFDDMSSLEIEDFNIG